ATKVDLYKLDILRNGVAMRGWLIAFLFCVSQAAAHDLVDLRKFNPKLCVDLRLAGSQNIFGFPIYPENCIYLERCVATRLGRIQRELAKEGLGLVVLEGYRPPTVQSHIDQIGWTCDYPNDAEHYRKGIGVDVMIYYLDGLPIKIPSFYQDKSRRACRDYPY